MYISGWQNRDLFEQEFIKTQMNACSIFERREEALVAQPGEYFDAPAPETRPV